MPSTPSNLPELAPSGLVDDAVTLAPTATAISSSSAAQQTAPTAGHTSIPEEDRKFIEQVVAWPDPQGPGWINLHVNAKNSKPEDESKKNNEGKPWVVGWPFQDLNEFIRRYTWTENTDQFFNVWICMSQQSDVKTTTVNGKTKTRAVRKAANATWLKAIWIDCDVKTGDPNHYGTLTEALDALDAFRRKVGLPLPSAVVNSGGGLHVYWISDAPISPDDWRPYADGLKALLVREGVKCDTGLTTDIARILRVPGTLNHKYDPPRKVELLHLGQAYDFPVALSVLHGVVPVTTAGPSAARPVIVPGHESEFDNGPDLAFAQLRGADDLIAGIARRSSVPLDPGPVFDKCGFMRDALLDGGKHYDNTLWMYSILSATFLQNGNALAHAISKDHPSYTYADTQEMYERKLADRADRGLGWPNCATIQGAGCKACATCSFLAEGKTPLHLTVPVTATVNQVMANPPVAWSASAMRVSFSNIRHRRTLYGFDLVRGEITLLGSPGGFGKSSLAIGMGISVAVGKELLEEKIRGSNLKVLLINGEDSREEIQRRVWAFSLAYSVTEQELDRLYVAGADDPCVQSLSFLKTNEKGHSQLDEGGLAQLRAALQSLSPDVVVLDPLVAFCASGNMNDNPSMSQVIRALKALATEFDCAILIVAHTNKTGEPGTAGAVSGAASIVNLARRAIMPVWVSEEEAKAWGILPSERARYIKLIDAKSNLVPRSNDVPVYRLQGVELPNADPPIDPLGDNVQAVVRVQVPIPNGITGSTDEEKIRKSILDLVDQGKTINGKAYPYSPSAAGADNARALLPDATAAARTITAPRQWSPGDLEAVVKNAIKSMLAEGALVSRPMKELAPKTDRFQRGRGLQVNHSHLSNGGSNAADTSPAA